MPHLKQAEIKTYVQYSLELSRRDPSGISETAVTLNSDDPTELKQFAVLWLSSADRSRSAELRVYSQSRHTLTLE